MLITSLNYNYISLTNNKEILIYEYYYLSQIYFYNSYTLVSDNL